MTKIFVGLLLMFFDFDINLSMGSISIIPDFIGGIAMYLGFKELADKNQYFEKAKSFSIILSVFSGITWIMNAFGIWSNNLILLMARGIAINIVLIYVLYLFTMGVKGLEETKNFSLGGNKLYNILTPFGVCMIGSGVIMFIVPILGAILVLAAFVLNIIFVVYVYGTKKAYEEYSSNLNEQ